MRCSTGTSIVALAVASLAVAQAVAGAARAETGAWEQRIAPAAKAKPSGLRDGARVQSRTVDPAHVPKGSLAGPASAKGKPAVPAAAASLPSKVEETGSDAAYEAFDQGRYLTALSLAAKRAAAGDAVSHTLVARIHAEGLGVPQDAKLAAQWYQRGADLGDVEAAFGLGILYARGEGVPKDFDKAAALLEKAALKGHPEAAYNLGLLFLSGKGKPESPHKGFMLVQYAAEKGVTSAMYDLGTLYATGTGTAANVFEAASWIGKAANAGHPDAEVEYAVILLKDHDVPAEQKARMQHRAVDLLHSAARKGLVVAQNRLAHCYAGGIGTAKDAVEAVKWHLVAKTGDGPDDEVLERLAGTLSRADRQKAAAAAAEWRETTLLD
ncbi:MAG: tetratricopeptide repeat protein [Hyphomicrobiaceae bacterium]